MKTPYRDRNGVILTAEEELRRPYEDVRAILKLGRQQKTANGGVLDTIRLPERYADFWPVLAPDLRDALGFTAVEWTFE